MTWVPKVNKMSFWARCDKNLQTILWSVSSKCLKQAQGGTDMEYRSRKNTMAAVDIVFSWHLGPIQPSLTVGSSEEVWGRRQREDEVMENRQRQLFYLLPLQKGTWLGARGVCVNGYGRGKEKRMCVCVLSGTVERVTTRFTQSLLWRSVLVQVKKPLLDNLSHGFGFETERWEWDIQECPAWTHTHCQGRWVLHHVFQHGNTILSPSNRLTPCIQKKKT